MRTIHGTDAFVAGIRRLVTPVTEYVVVHSRMGSFVDAVDPYPGAIEGWRRFADETGATVCFPTFTPNALSSGAFDRERSRSESGELGMQFWRAVPGAQRTEHPMYSYVVYGPGAESVLACSGEASCGDGSTFELFAQQPTTMVTFGLDLYWISFYHYLETKLEVPYRFDKPFEGVVRSLDEERKYRVTLYARKLHLEADLDFRRLADEIKRRVPYRSADILGTRCEAVTAAEILEVQGELMAADSKYLLADRAKYDGNARRLRFSFLSSDNLDVFARIFDTEATGWLREGVKTHQLPFGTYRTELLKPFGLLQEYDPHIMVFAEQSEGLLADALAGFEGAAPVEARIDEYVMHIQQAREISEGHILVCDFAPPSSSLLGFADATAATGAQATIAAANARLAERLKGVSNCRIFPFAETARRHGVDGLRDDKFWFTGRIPFSEGFSRYLSRRLTGFIMAMLGRTARAVVVDLDNTLWQGLVGEGDVILGGDFPGNCYRRFQEQLRSLRQRGILLGICSKNEKKAALDVMNEHPEMVLRPADFASIRINWSDKTANLVEIARELNIGLSSICFLDDSVHERAMVRELLPEVFVPDVPEDPAQLPRLLERLPCLEALELTAEDWQRAVQVERQAQMRAELAGAASRDGFLAGLNMTLYIGEWTEWNRARTVQLVQKTNQFNTTGRRYTQDDLQKLCADGHTVYTFGLSDRLSPKEFIGLVVVEWPAARNEAPVVKLFVMSCRVMERGVEDAVLGWLGLEVQRRGWSRLQGEVVETERNQPARSLFARSGFVAVTERLFEIDLRRTQLKIPRHFSVRGPDER